MINSLEIENIQSHEHTKLDFTDHVNVIIGSSNQGKSAILRALYWIKNNRPLGIDNLASHWIVNDKGYLTGEMSAKLENDKGVVERRRTKDDNQYIVNGNVLNVVKTDIPFQVSNLLNLSDTNVQKQLDSPFLLSQTSGEVARYFNQIVNLDVIDKVLTNAETKRRKLKNRIDACGEEIDRIEEKLDEFNWIDDVSKYMENYLYLKTNYKSTGDAIDEMTVYFHSYDDSIEWVDWVSEFIEDTNSIVSEIESIERKIDEIKPKLNDLLSSFMFIKSVEIYDFTSQKRCMDKIIFVNNEINRVSLDGIRVSIDDYEKESAYAEKQDRIIVDYKAMLPNVCPLCGSLLEDGKCVSC